MMQFLGINAELFTTLALALGAILALLYLVKLRRRRIEVPYSLFWQRILEERTATGLWRRLKRLTSLMVALLILFLILFALRDPRPETELVERRHLLLVIDTSASMAAVDMPGGRDRMESAREIALEVFDSLGADDDVMVVRMDGQIRPLTPFVRPSEVIREMIERLDYTATTADLLGMLTLAAASLEGRSRPEMILIGDGAYQQELVEQAAAITLPQAARFRFIQVGQADGNVAITAFNARRYPTNRLNYEVYIQLTSSFDVEVTVKLSLAANGTVIEQVLVELPPGETEERVYPNLATGGAKLEARIELIAGDVNDVFALDDTGYALLPHERATRLLLVSSDNLFVEAPFILNQNIQLTRITPGEYQTGQERGDPSHGFDVTVINGPTPPLPEEGNYLLIDPSGLNSPWTVSGETEDPIIDRFDRRHPLMRWLHGFRSLNVLRANELDLGQEDVAIAWSIGGDPMIVARVEERRRLVALAFAVEESDLALRLEYPLFILNAIDWLTWESSDLIDGYLTGRAYQVPLQEREVETAWLVPPHGEPERIDLIDGFLTFFPTHPGFHEIFYELEGSLLENPVEEPDLVLAANLSNTVESTIGANLELPWSVEESDEAQQDTGSSSRHDPWFFLVLVAIGLLFLDWITFNRRITV